MEKKPSALLPYVMQVLSRKPRMSDTIDNLCRDIKEQLIQEKKMSRDGDLSQLMQIALDIGQDLGIVYTTNDTVRLPIKLHTSKQEANGNNNENTNSKNVRKWPERQYNTSTRKQGAAHFKYGSSVIDGSLRSRRSVNRGRPPSSRRKASRRLRKLY